MKNKISLVGYFYLACFGMLIIGGIVIKRIYHYPEWVTAFHLPAAVFLVLAGYELTSVARQKYKEMCENMDLE